jgi:hypothetical protein
MNEEKLDVFTPTEPVVPVPPTPQSPVKRGPGRPRKDGSQVGTPAGKAPGNADLVRSAEAAWQALWVLLRILGSFLGYTSDVKTLPEEEAKSDATAIATFFAGHQAAFKVLSFLGAPLVLIQRVTQHFSKKKAVEPSKEKSDASER